MFNLFRQRTPTPVYTTEPSTEPHWIPGKITQMKNGRYRLLINGNEQVATYARRSDAIRGADRRRILIER